MLEIILGLLSIGILWKFIKLTFVVTWGLLKIVGILLSVVAFPVLFVGLLVVGVGTYLALPILLIGLAFGCLAKS